MKENYCPKCGRFKSSEFALCGRCQREYNIEKYGTANETYIAILKMQKEMARRPKPKPVCKRCGKESYKLLCDECKQELQYCINPTSNDNFHEKFDQNKKHKCKSGDYVRSYGERTIADFLYDNNIPFEYEPECNYGIYEIDTGYTRTKLIIPDFFIKGPATFNGRLLQNVYIEFWGMENEEYNERKKNKFIVYKAHRCTLINIYPEDLFDYENSLSQKLIEFENCKINY